MHYKTSYKTRLKNANLDAFIALRRPFLDPAREEQWRKLVAEMLLVPLEITIGGRGSYSLKARLLTRQEFPAPFLAALPNPLPPVSAAIHCRVAVRCSPTIEVTTNRPDLRLSLAQVRSLERLTAAEAIANSYRDLVLCANIAAPGLVGLSSGVVVSRREVLLTLDADLPDVLEEAVDSAAELGWPQIHQLPISDVWQWFVKQEALSSPATRTRRAINALSYLVRGTDDVAVKLMWAMVGIEALFASGRGAILEQMRERSRLLLGESPRAAKIVSRMYDLRSRFVHGDLNFARAHAESDPRDDEAYWASNVAVAMLLAALQELIRRDWCGAEFVTVCGPA